MTEFNQYIIPEVGRLYKNKGGLKKDGYAELADCLQKSPLVVKI